MSRERLELSEEEIFREITHLMNNETIRPEPEYQFFAKYLAISTKEDFFLDDHDIFHLVNAHGVQLRNDIKYWIDKCKTEGPSEEVKRMVPVLNPKHFQIQDFNDLVKKLKELPSDWTVLQITKKFSLGDVAGKEEVPEIHLTRLPCGDLAKRVHPYSLLAEDNYSQENVFKILTNLIEMRKEFYNMGRTCKKLYEAYYKTNSELENFIKELESYVLGPWVCLFQGRMEDSSLEDETLVKIRNLIDSFWLEEGMQISANEKQIDLIYRLTSAAHLLEAKSMFSALRSLLYGKEKNLVNANKLMMLVENIKILNLSNSCAIKRAKRKPLILILDNDFEIIPWEMLTILSGQPVCRISSVHLLYALYKYHEPLITNGYRIVEIDCTYALINPSQDLKECEKEMGEFLKKRIPWAEVVIGKAPDPTNLLSKIGDCSTYLYCGHGSGNHYLKSRELKKAFVGGLMLLFGCSSNIPKNCGGRTPHQNHTYTYISNGCPCIVGCILDLGSTEADAVCKELLTNIMPTVTVEGKKKKIQEPIEPDVLKALANGRSVCPKYWSKSAFVARGIPCKTAVGDVNAITTSNCL